MTPEPLNVDSQSLVLTLHALENIVNILLNIFFLLCHFVLVCDNILLILCQQLGYEILWLLARDQEITPNLPKFVPQCDDAFYLKLRPKYSCLPGAILCL